MSSEVAQESSTPSTQQASARPPSFQNTLSKYLGSGNIGQLPVVLALIIIAIFFQITSPDGVFLSPRNLSNLILQGATLGTLGLASTLVLLIGEIDLSLGVVSYATAAITVIYSVYHGWSTVPALLIGLLAGVVIGLVNGFFVAVLRVPSFVVTLAGLLGYQGFVIHILYPQTTLGNRDQFIFSLVTSYLPDYLGIGLPVLAVVIYAGGTLFARIQRQRNGLAVGPIWTTWLRIAVTLVLVIGVISLFESYRGVPLAAVILSGLILLFWLVLRFTAFGRHVYAVGGNAEAARRAGINVVGIRIAVFTMASVLATVGGLLAVSRLDAATAQVDPTLLLNAIAIAVIGGVSLFGGRGSVWGVALGLLIIEGISNGMALLNQTADVVYIVEGVVLIIAVTADAIARRRRAVGAR
ncbi:MAG TPA: inner-membrane translocator [Ktedonobacterales bacterium]|nr:inner-membrane translocator [Ktedonobacterales bacterium]